jgi:hypothetical protein
MEYLLKKLKEYLEALGAPVEGMADRPEISLPLMVAGQYRIVKANLLNKELSLFIWKNRNNLSYTPQDIIVHAKLIRQHFTGQFAFVLPEASKSFLKKLIQENIAFIIPGKQIFLPDKYVFLNNAPDMMPKVKKNFSPWTQVILLYYLLHSELDQEVDFGYWLDKLRLHKVYLSRHAQELEQAGLAEVVPGGHGKSILFLWNRRELWEKAREYLVSPVQKRIRVNEISSSLLYGGISALSHYSNLGENDYPTYAIYKKLFKKEGFEQQEFEGPEVEIWKYDPRLLTMDGQFVDPLSLYLSLENDDDPRVEGELHRMLKRIII